MDTIKEIDSKKFSLASLFDSFESSIFRSLRGQDVDMLGGYCNDQTSSTAMKRKYLCVERAPPPLILVDEISTTQQNLQHENEAYDKTFRRRSYTGPSLDTPPFIETASNGHPNCHRQSLMNSPEGQPDSLPEVALNVSALTEVHALEYKKRYDLALSILLSLVEKKPPQVALLYKPFICDMLKRFRSEGSKVYRQNPFTVHLLENMYESYASGQFTKTQSVKADVEQQPLDMRKIKGSKDDRFCEQKIKGSKDDRYCEREFKREISSIDSFDWSSNDLNERHQKQKCYAQQDIKGIDLTKSQNVSKTNELWTNIVQPCTGIQQPVLQHIRENTVADDHTFKKSILSEQDMSRDIIHNRRYQDRTIHKQPATLRKQRLDYSTHRVKPLVSPQNELIDDLRSTPLEQDVQKRILTVNTNSLIDENRFDEAVLILLRRVRQLLHSPETAELLIRHYLRKFERVSPDIQARNMLTNRINEAINIMAEEATARGSTMHEISVIKMGFTVAQFLSLIDAIDSNRVVPLSGPLLSTLPDKIQRLRDDISFINQNQTNKCATTTSQRIPTNDIYQKQSRHTDLGVVDNKQEHHSTPVSDGHNDFGQVVCDFSQRAMSRHNTNNNVHCRDVGVNTTVGRQNSDPTYLPSDRHSYVSPYVTSTGSNDTSDVNVYKHQGFLGNRQNNWSNSIPTPYSNVESQILSSTDAMHTNTLTSADMVMTNSNQTVMSTRLNDPPPYYLHAQPWSLHTRDQAFYHDQTPQTVPHPPSNILSQGQTQGYGLHPMGNLNFQQGTMMFNPYVYRRRRKGKPRGGKKQTETERLTKSDSKSKSCECDRPTTSTAEETSTRVDKTDTSTVDNYIQNTIANVQNELLQRNETKITQALSEKLSSAGKDTAMPQPVVPNVFEVIDVDDDDNPVERLDHLPKKSKVGEKVRATEEIDQLLKQHYSDQSNTKGHIFKIPFKIDVSGVQLEDNREEVNFATMSSIVNWTIESEVSLSETPLERDITQSEPRKDDVMSPTVNEPEPCFKPVEASKYMNTPDDGLDTSLTSNSVCCSNTAGSSTSSRGSPDSLMMDVILDSISAAVMHEDTESKSHVTLDGFTSAPFPSNKVSTTLIESKTCKNLISTACSKLHELSSDSTCKSSEKTETVPCTVKDIAEKESKIHNDNVPCKKGYLENFDSRSSSNFVIPECEADLVISQDSGSFNIETDSLINMNIPKTSGNVIGHPNLQSEQTSSTGMIVPVSVTNTYGNILPSETCSGSSDVVQSESKSLIYNLNCRESIGIGATDPSIETHSHCLKQGIDIETGRCTADSTAESKIHQIDRLSPDLTVLDRTNRKVTETLHLASGQHVAVMEKEINPPAASLKSCAIENFQSNSELPEDYVSESEDGNVPAFEYDNSISFEVNSPRLAENGRQVVYNKNCSFAEGKKNSNDDHEVACPSEALFKCNDTNEDFKCTMRKNMINKNKNANHAHIELLECTNSLNGTYGNLNEYERRLSCNLNSKNIEISATDHVSSVITNKPMSSGKFGIQTLTHPCGISGSLMSRISVDPVSNIVECHESDEVLNVGSSEDAGDDYTPETTLLNVASEVRSVTSPVKEGSNEFFDYHEGDNDNDDDNKCVLDRTETGIFIKDVFSIDRDAVVVQFDDMLDVATEEVDFETSRDSGEANETNFSPSVEEYDFDTQKQDHGKARSDTEALEENTLKGDRNDTSVYVENFTEDGKDIPFIESQSSFISDVAATEATKDHPALCASSLQTHRFNPANTPPSIETTLVDMDSYCGYVDSFRTTEPSSVQGEKLNSPLIALFTDVIYDYPRIVMTWFVCLICHYATCNAASVDRHFSEVHNVKNTENLTIESRDCFVSLQRLNENETIKVYNRKRKKTTSHAPKLGTKRAFCQKFGAITNPTPVASKRSVFSCDKCAQVFTYSFALKKHRRSTCKFSHERLKLMQERQNTNNENLMVDKTAVKIDRGRESLGVNLLSDIEKTFEDQYKSPVSTSVEVSHSTHGKINQAEKYCWGKDKNIEVLNDRPPHGGGPRGQSSLRHVMDGNTSMDDDNCAKCRKRYQQSDLRMDPWIQCDKCSLWFHGSCQKLGFDDVIALGHSDVDFICKDCKRKRSCRGSQLRDKSITPLLTTLSREFLQL